MVLLLGSTKSRALWVSCVAQLMVVLDITVVNVALPSIQADLGLGRAAASWVALAYSLGFAGVLLVGARLADVIGTARVLAWGIIGFTVASAAGGLATEGWLLIAARAGQGLSAAVVSPATFTLLTTSYAEGPARTRAVAAWTAVSLAGGGVGNITSGVLTDLISWRAVLLINVPIGVAVVVGTLFVRQPGDDRRGGRIDLIGAVLATGAFLSATYALTVLGERGVATMPVASALASAALFVALVVQQRRTGYRLVPAALLRNRLVVVGNVATSLTAVCFQVGLWYFLTYRMQGPLGYTPIQAGLAFLPLTVTMLAVNTWASPRLLRNVPAATVVCAGAMLAGLGLLWQAFADGASFVHAILGPSIVIGAGGGLLSTPLATIVTSGVSVEEAGAASGLMNTGKQFGGAVGLAAATAVTIAFDTDKAAFLMMAGGLGVVALLSLRLAPHLRRPQTSTTQAGSPSPPVRA